MNMSFFSLFTKCFKFKKINYFIRNLSITDSYQKDTSLKGRKYIVPEDLSANEMKSLFLTAVELKTTEQSYLGLLTGKKMTLLLHQPCLKLQTILHDTSTFLKMPLNTLLNSHWEKLQNTQDIGKLLSTTTDIIFCRAHSQIQMENFARGCTVPIININSCEFNPLQILSELLTLQENFGTLNGIIFAWVGSACPQLNTYLTIAPTLGMKVKFLCQCGGPVSPSHLNHAQSLGSKFTERIEECRKLEEVYKGANVIATSEHHEKNLTIKLVDLEKYAAENWVFLHSLPRSSGEVEDKIFDSKRNLLWKSFVNSKWICAAFILKFLGKDQKLIFSSGANECTHTKMKTSGTNISLVYCNSLIMLEVELIKTRSMPIGSFCGSLLSMEKNWNREIATNKVLVNKIARTL